MSVLPLPQRLRLANEEPVQMFWFGGPLPEAHKICLQTWVQQGYCPQLWQYEPLDPIDGVDHRDANQIVPESVANDWLELPDRHARQTFANGFRYALMLRTSGWWADTDFLCLGRLPVGESLFTTILDIPTRPELLELYPSLPHYGGNIQNSLFKVDHLDAQWLTPLALETWRLLQARECPAFGVAGTVWFTKALRSCYRIIPIKRLIGNNWTDRDKIFTDPDWRPAAWARVLHLYNFTQPHIDAAIPGSCWSELAGRVLGTANTNS